MAGGNPQSSIGNPSALPWPTSLADQFAAVLKLLPATGPDPAALAACFGKRTPKRVEQIAGILETLASMGKL